MQPNTSTPLLLVVDDDPLILQVMQPCFPETDDCIFIAENAVDIL